MSRETPSKGQGWPEKLEVYLSVGGPTLRIPWGVHPSSRPYVPAPLVEEERERVEELKRTAKKYQDALARIGSCEKRADGDTVDIARAALHREDGE